MPKVAHLFVGVEVAGRDETRGAAGASCTAHRIEAYDLSDNEMAKLHVRHLVGGHAPAAENEILYRFEFPERPGALMRFLDSMSAGWNISLFHYRNHGADYGRVLVGMQVPPSDKAEFRRFLDRLGYDYVDETGESRLPDVPRSLTGAPVPRAPRTRQPAAPAAACAAGGKLPRVLLFSRFRPARADSGKVYALGNAWPWQTRQRGEVWPTNGTAPRTAWPDRDQRGRQVGGARSRLSGVKVMVIDDSNTIRRSAEIFLLQAGCTVILAEDGFDALAKIADHQPDLVFVDIMMPRLDGYQTCALIKKNAKFQHTPVIMLSSKDGLFDRARGRMVGSDQYLTKPFTKESLLKAVAAHVNRLPPRAMTARRSRLR